MAIRSWIAAGLIGVAAPAMAQRIDTTRLGCGEVRAIVSQRGAVVLGSGPDIYDRFVSSRQYCMYDERTEPAFAPARDNPQCPIGYQCRERENNRLIDD